MRINFRNTAKDLVWMKTFEFLPAVQIAWWVAGGQISLYWLNFGVEIAFGKRYNE